MWKVALSIAGLSALGLAVESGTPEPPLKLKEEAMIIEYTATSNEAAIVVMAESEESLGLVEIHDPTGKSLLRLGIGKQPISSLSGFIIESKEDDPATLLARFGAGQYNFGGRTRGGQRVTGRALFSHALPSPTTVLYPTEGERGVFADALTVRWVPNPEAVNYQVVLEQGENDTLTATMPAGSSQFQVPPGLLEGGLLSHVEIGAIAANGNRTMVEVEFTTR